MTDSEIFQSTETLYKELVILLKTQKLRQGLEFDLARFEADLLSVQSLDEETLDTGGNSAKSESVGLLIPPLLQRLRGLGISLQREGLSIPEDFLGKLSALEQALISQSDRPATARIEGVLGI